MQKRSLRRSFKSASEGLFHLLKTHPHFALEILFGLAAIALGIFLNINYLEWLIILLLIMLGLVIEMLNTSIEEVCNAVTTEFNPNIKLAKDIAGAAVLIFVALSLVIAGMIFLPKIF
jgi:diacylglycerol kinase